MLEPSARRAYLRRQTTATAVIVSCGALAALVVIDRPEPEPAVAIELPALPPTIVAVPAPAVVQPEPAPPMATACPASVADVGIPVARAPVDVNAPPLVDVAVSREGCTLVARTESALAISWDGGQTFVRHELAGIGAPSAGGSDRAPIVALESHVLVQRDGKLGTIAPDQPIVWRAVPAKLATSRLLAAGPWTVLVAEGVAGVSDDDGASWRYLDVPTDITVTRVDADGRIAGTRTKVIEEFDGNGAGEYATIHLVADALHPTWRPIATHSGGPADDSGRYALERDEFWGCGGSQKLVWVGGGKSSSVAGGLRTEVWPIEVRTTGKVTFASLRNQLVRLDRASGVDLGEIPGHLAGVDASGTPIVQTDTQVQRWSKTGGWRVLFDSR